MHYTNDMMCVPGDMLIPRQPITKKEWEMATRNNGQNLHSGAGYTASATKTVAFIEVYGRDGPDRAFTYHKVLSMYKDVAAAAAATPMSMKELKNKVRNPEHRTIIMSCIDLMSLTSKDVDTVLGDLRDPLSRTSKFIISTHHASIAERSRIKARAMSYGRPNHEVDAMFI